MPSWPITPPSSRRPLQQAISYIREATYSFTQASVASSRLIDENFLYEASFQPLSNEPFWQGHIKKYSINNDGSIGSVAWDAGEVLQSTSASSRTIYTVQSRGAHVLHHVQHHQDGPECDQRHEAQ